MGGGGGRRGCRTEGKSDTEMLPTPTETYFLKRLFLLFGGQMKQISGFSPQNAPLGSSRPTIPLHTPQTHTKHPPDPGKFATASPTTCPRVRQPRKHCGVLVFSLKSLFFTSSSEQTHPFLNAWKTPSKLGAFPYSSKQL